MRIFIRKFAHEPSNINDSRILQSHWPGTIFGSNLSTRFSQGCSFRRMLMNHKNFRFTQMPDKSNDMIFLKSPKTLFLGHF